MPNRGYSTIDRMAQNGPTAVQPLREMGKRDNGVPMMDAECALIPETVGCQFRRGGWDKYEVPTGNDGDTMNDLHKFIVPGGDANMNGSHIVAAYPGGTVA